MWLITSLLAAIIITVIRPYTPKKFKLGFLALMLWGLTIMVFIDHIMGYKDGSFIEIETDGLIQNGTLLGITMLIPVFFIWVIALFISKAKAHSLT
jgi:membrane protein YdbS with pleckstrin-like domain